MAFRIKTALLFWLLCMMHPAKLCAQKPGQKKVDSLLGKLTTIKEDTSGVHLLNGLSAAYQHIIPDSGIYYGNRALALAQQIAYKKGIGRANFYIGRNYYNKVMNNYFDPQNHHPKNDYIKTWKYFIEAERVFELIGDKDGQAAAFSAISGIYFNQSDYESCLEYDRKALRIYEQLGDKKEMFLILGAVANDYRMLKQYALSLTYYLKAIETAKEVNETKRIIGFNRNIGDLYLDSANYPMALQYYTTTLEMANEKIEDSNLRKMFVAIVYADISGTYSLLNDHVMALKYAYLSLQYNEAIGQKNRTANALAAIGNSYLDWARLPGHLFTASIDKAHTLSLSVPISGMVYAHTFSLSVPGTKTLMIEEAIMYLKRSVDSARKINLYGSMKLSYRSLYEAYKLKGDHKTALECYEHYILIKDSTHIKEEEEKLMKQQMQYELDKIAILTKSEQDKKVALAQKNLLEERNMRYAITGIAVLLLVIAAIALNAYRQKQKHNVTISVEKQRSEDLLLNILPAEIAEELKESGTSKARHFTNVTVMFTDFVSFTKAGERMTPEELVNELDACFKAFDNIIGKYGIEKIKTIGDAYLAVSGLPKGNSNHATDIVTAAREIVDYMHNRKAELGSGTFEIRVGVHSGDVVAGIVGIKKFAYDVWGDTVNTAARMEQSSQPGKVNISESTYQLIKHKFTCTYRGEITARNKGNMNMYFVDAEVEAIV